MIGFASMGKSVIEFLDGWAPTRLPWIGALFKFPVLVLLLAICGLPLFVVIALIAMHSNFVLGNDFFVLFNDIDELADKAHLLPIPLFVFAGFLLARSGAPKRLVRLADAVFGALPGGLAIVSICACTFFTTFTGASGVTIIALGGLLFPVLMERGYPEKFSLGLLTSAGSLGLLFFPALPVFIFAVVYGISTESADVTPEGLFLAGFLPGVLLTVVLCIYAWLKGVRLNIARRPFDLRELGAAFKGAFWEAMLPVLLISAIVTGTTTLSEVATLTCVYLIIVEMVIYRELHPIKDLPRLVADSMVLVGAIVLIMAMIMPTKDILAEERVPERILEWFGQFIHSKIGFLIVLNFFLLVVGCLMDIFSAIVAVLPLLIPLSQRYGIDPLHLGVIFLTNLEIGYLTPPVGINLFISSFQFKRPVLSIYKSVIPYIVLMFGSLVVITYVPTLSSIVPDNVLEVPLMPHTQHFLGPDAEDDDNELSDDELFEKYLNESPPDGGGGDLVPGGGGDLAPDGGGDLMPDGGGDLMPDDSGDLMPDDSGDLLPDDSGDLAPDDSGDLAPD